MSLWSCTLVMCLLATEDQVPLLRQLPLAGLAYPERHHLGADLAEQMVAHHHLLGLAEQRLNVSQPRQYPAALAGELPSTAIYADPLRSFPR